MAWITALTDSLAWQTGVLLLLPVVLLLLSLAAGRRRPDGEKLSSYECGFEPVGDARLRFDVFYYVVGLLFLLFDLEIVLLVPYTLASFEGPGPLFGVTALFTLLTLGFVYEWTRGALKVVSPALSREEKEGGKKRRRREERTFHHTFPYGDLVTT